MQALHTSFVAYCIRFILIQKQRTCACVCLRPGWQVELPEALGNGTESWRREFRGESPTQHPHSAQAAGTANSTTDSSHGGDPNATDSVASNASTPTQGATSEPNSPLPDGAIAPSPSSGSGEGANQGGHDTAAPASNSSSLAQEGGPVPSPPLPDHAPGGGVAPGVDASAPPDGAPEDARSSDWSGGGQAGGTGAGAGSAAGEPLPSSPPSSSP
jgi:hypothetical protein